MIGNARTPGFSQNLKNFINSPVTPPLAQSPSPAPLNSNPPHFKKPLIQIRPRLPIPISTVVSQFVGNRCHVDLSPIYVLSEINNALHNRFNSSTFNPVNALLRLNPEVLKKGSTCLAELIEKMPVNNQKHLKTRRIYVAVARLKLWLASPATTSDQNKQQIWDEIIKIASDPVSGAEAVECLLNQTTLFKIDEFSRHIDRLLRSMHPSQQSLLGAILVMQRCWHQPAQLHQARFELAAPPAVPDPSTLNVVPQSISVATLINKLRQAPYTANKLLPTILSQILLLDQRAELSAQQIDYLTQVFTIQDLQDYCDEACTGAASDLLLNILMHTRKISVQEQPPALMKMREGINIFLGVQLYVNKLNNSNRINPLVVDSQPALTIRTGR